MMKTSRLMLAVVTVVVLPAVLFGQNSGPVTPKPLPKLKPDTLREANRTGEARATANKPVRKVGTATDRRIASIKEQISFLNPAVPKEMLSRDEAVVKQAIIEAGDDFKAAGFDETDVEEAVLAAWFYIRIEAVINITVRILLGSTNDLGKVVINSDPDQAEIAVEGQPTGNRTLYKTWLPAGTYKIRLSKPGYLTTEDKCEVLKGRKNEFTKTLIRQP